MYHNQRKIYWLEGLKRHIAEFVAKCLNCQQIKAKHQKLGDLLHEIQIPTWKWEDLNMDFVVGLPQTQKSYDSIWVAVDRLIKSAQSIPIKSTYSVEDYERIFIDEIVCRHGILVSIISDRGAQFTSRFWRSFQKELGTTVKLRTDFHP